MNTKVCQPPLPKVEDEEEQLEETPLLPNIPLQMLKNSQKQLLLAKVTMCLMVVMFFLHLLISFHLRR
eukprot:JP448550.1.p4 GENE.JP448550.1~~JP448550.1.p4  ORF type:complete len:68 (+),score=13.42 JP448550.1:129-332(+)